MLWYGIFQDALESWRNKVFNRILLWDQMLLGVWSTNLWRHQYSRWPCTPWSSTMTLYSELNILGSRVKCQMSPEFPNPPMNVSLVGITTLKLPAKAGFNCNEGFCLKRFFMNCSRHLEKYIILTFYALSLLHKHDKSKW